MTYILPNSKKKLTKKQRKASRPPNFAVQQSIKNGTRMSPIHCGALPEFSVTYPLGPNMPPKIIQVKKGVPFVNMTLRKETNNV